MDNQPIYFEGAAVITNVIATGAAFGVTNLGDVYIPAKVAKAYNLRVGQCIDIAARKNFKTYNDSAPYIIIDVKDVNGSSSSTVTTHVTEAVVEVEAPTPFEDLSDDDRWEAVLSVSEDTPMFGVFGLLEALGITRGGDQVNQHQAVAEYLDQCVSSSALWNVSVSQGTEENTEWFCEYYMLHPEKDFMRGPNQA
jgi:bifunctional DNA-binding transcriptional regulator/antitoxin component of YhaV-PrlF toxin-antitoxin module